MVVGFVVLALNALASAWGGIAWYRRDPSTGFWYVLRAAQASVVAQAVLGGVLVATGEEPEGLHLFYGVLPLFIALVTEAMRVGAAQVELAEVEDVKALEHRDQVLLARRVVLREMAIMSVGTLMTVTLALRAAGIF